MIEAFLWHKNDTVRYASAIPLVFLSKLSSTPEQLPLDLLPHLKTVRRFLLARQKRNTDVAAFLKYREKTCQLKTFVKRRKSRIPVNALLYVSASLWSSVATLTDSSNRRWSVRYSGSVEARISALLELQTSFKVYNNLQTIYHLLVPFLIVLGVVTGILLCWGLSCNAASVRNLPVMLCLHKQLPAHLSLRSEVNRNQKKKGAWCIWMKERRPRVVAHERPLSSYLSYHFPALSFVPRDDNTALMSMHWITFRGV